MKFISKIGLLIIGCSLFNACETLIQKEDLYGTWQAVALTEEGESLQVNLEEIQLSFNKQYYEFHSTLNYKEAGHFQVQSNLLLTKDTLKNSLLEKSVEITKFQNDSLFVRMNEQGRERRLVLVRK